MDQVCLISLLNRLDNTALHELVEKVVEMTAHSTRFDWYRSLNTPVAIVERHCFSFAAFLSF